MRKSYLFAPGPTPVPPETLLEMARPIIHHREPEFKPILEACRRDLQYLFETTRDVVILASSLMMAVSPLRLIRIFVINKSSHVIYMELKGEVNDNFYYLTIPKGTKKLPEYAEYTVVEDIYKRTTWYGPGDLGCEGFKSTGQLWAVKQMKLNFVPCGAKLWKPWVSPWDGLTYWRANSGEPTWGEKVVYFKYINAWGYKIYGGLCGYGVKTYTWKTPRKNCFFLYKY